MNIKTNGISTSDQWVMTQMIENYGLTATLSAIGAICHDKAQHLIDGDDKHAAGPWVKAGDIIEGTVTATDGWPS
jgi:hypothetical protein